MSLNTEITRGLENRENQDEARSDVGGRQQGDQGDETIFSSDDINNNVIPDPNNNNAEVEFSSSNNNNNNLSESVTAVNDVFLTNRTAPIPLYYPDQAWVVN